MSYGLLGLLIALLRDQVHRRVQPDKGQHTYDEDDAEQDRYSYEVSPGISLQKSIFLGLGINPRQGQVIYKSHTGSVETESERPNRVKHT